ncbi:TonB-dependent receptor family protein [Halioxenophilus aromaticivorans]|uniref:TonB-dependent receptor n=1 Tax=Halioxenophilus aromaticivorans TaxID=1306992 RepID=A0AAV3U421_9ALTE
MKPFFYLKFALYVTLPTSLLISTASLAAGLGQQSNTLEEVTVTAESNSRLSARSANDAIIDLERIPGGIGLVKAEDYLVEFTQSIGDALEFIPGVFADTSAQRENRISIRGSGANATFERRGITVLRDGVPISRASGITEYQEIDPLSVDYIEVYKGANGLRYGAASLGGAINVVTPTGATSEPGTSLRLEGGSFDTQRVSINTKGATDTVDYYGAVTQLQSDGFRSHAEVDSIYSFGNLGIKISDNIETRFYLTALQDNYELAGSGSLEQALSDPEQSPEANHTFDQDRNLEVYRVSNRTVFEYMENTLEIGAWLAERTLDHAITPFVGIIDQEESEVGLSLQLNGSATLGVPVDWTLGAMAAQSDNEANVYGYAVAFGPTAGPAKGEITSYDDQQAQNTTAYAELDFNLTNSLNLILSTQYLNSERDNRNRFNADPDDNLGGINDDTGKLNFEKLSARLGVLYAVNENIQIYTNVSEGYEPPGMSDLTSGGAEPFTELKAQESLTVEIGSRGHWQAASWDVAIYRSKIVNEFIDVAAPGFGGSTTNTDNAAGDTVHFGLELGMDLRLHRNLAWRNTFTYNDFSFAHNDNGDYSGNELPGIPASIYLTELRYDHNKAWHAGVNLRYVPDGAYADYANTVKAPGYELLGMFAGITLADSVTLFASAENLTNEKYIANISTVADLSTASSSNVFTPGQGRALYVGMSVNF